MSATTEPPGVASHAADDAAVNGPGADGAAPGGPPGAGTTETDQSGTDGTGADAAGAGSPRGRRATRWYAAFTAVATVALVVLGLEGWNTAKGMRGGATTEVISDPDAPGFIATVDPTPVHLVALTTSADELSAVFVIVPAARGGTVVWTLGELVVDVDGEPKSLAELYATAGVEVAVDELERAMGMGVTDVSIVGPAQLAAIAAPALPLTVDNPDRVRVEDGGRRTERFASGELSLDGDELFEFLAVRGVGEAPENRWTRADAVLAALAPALAEADAPRSEVTSSGGVDLGEVVATLGRGQFDFVLLPTTRQSFATSYMYRPDLDAIALELAGVVRFPVSAFPGQRPRVRVRNGTTTTDAARRVAPDLAAVGGEVVVIGNTNPLDAAATSVVYSDPAFEEVARRVADALGVAAERRDEVSDAADIDVVLGPDQNA